MKVSEHLLYGGAASLALIPAFGNKSLFFFLGSILIDLDHYIDFLYYSRFKNWSIKKMFKFHGTMSSWKYRPNILALEAFHTMEFLLIFFFISFLTHSKELSLFWFGMIFHLGLDVIRLQQLKIVNNRALSFIEYWIRAKKMKKTGNHPEKIFEEVYRTIK
ncbi:MAG: hypothetical protein HYT97_00820 [Elusimicrobia bacterium]|nr:hypothetical protein [Elusimicrobiota bacterium]